VDHVDVLVLVFGIVLAGSVLIALAALVVRRRVFAGEPSDEWRRVQRELTWPDKMQVMGATMHQNRVGRPGLEQAQLVYVRYCQHVSERSPLLTHPKLRVFLGVSYMVVALGEVAWAIGGHGSERVLAAGSAVIFASQGGLWSFVFSRNLERRRGQMARLRRRIEQDYAD
jgi:hypothetical protein